MLNLIARLGPLLTAAAVCVVLGSSLVDLQRARARLDDLVSRQAQGLKTDAKVQSQVESLAKGVQSLALAGNPNAQRIVAVLKQNGVSIKGQ